MAGSLDSVEKHSFWPIWSRKSLSQVPILDVENSHKEVSEICKVDWKLLSTIIILPPCFSDCLAFPKSMNGVFYPIVATITSCSSHYLSPKQAFLCWKWLIACPPQKVFYFAWDVKIPQVLLEGSLRRSVWRSWFFPLFCLCKQSICTFSHVVAVLRAKINKAISSTAYTQGNATDSPCFKWQKFLTDPVTYPFCTIFIQECTDLSISGKVFLWWDNFAWVRVR